MKQVKEALITAIKETREFNRMLDLKYPELLTIRDNNKMKMKTLKEFLEKHDACDAGYEFAKDLTLKQFLETCPRGDWILWLFRRSNPRDRKLRVLVAAHCANTVRHLMKDERSTKAVDTAIAYGEGRSTIELLDVAAAAADAAADAAAADAYAYAAAADADAYAAATATAAAADADATAAAYAAATAAAADVAYAYADAERKKNRKQTADICREYLPIELWNIK